MISINNNTMYEYTFKYNYNVRHVTDILYDYFIIEVYYIFKTVMLINIENLIFYLK